MNFSHPFHEWLTDSVVVWDTRYQSADLGLFQDSDLACDLADSQNLTLVQVARTCKFHTAAPKERKSRQTLVFDWNEFPR